MKLNSTLKTEAMVAVKPGEVPQVDEEIVETPWLKIDDVFYEARGQAWALSHLLRAIEVDFADVLAKRTPLSACVRSFVSWKLPKNRCGVRWCSTAARSVCCLTTRWSWLTIFPALTPL